LLPNSVGSKVEVASAAAGARLHALAAAPGGTHDKPSARTYSAIGRGNS
jgi:hypothetical protein